MKYVIVSIIIILLINLYPVRAREVSSDAFILDYEPAKVYSMRSTFVPGEVKRRMPIENYVPTNSEIEQSTLEVLPIHAVKKESFLIPQIAITISNLVKKSTSTFYFSYIKTIGTILSNVQNLFEKKEVLRVPEKKKVTPPQVAKPDFTSLPDLESVNGMHSRFQGDPYSDNVPFKAKEVYTWDRLWNPAYNPQSYLQCTTYVAMIYNLNGISLHGKVAGDAREWVHFTETFYVFENGKTTTLPKVMDIAVWAKNGSNHVGVISAVSDTSITIMNANAEKDTYTYTLTVSDEGVVTLSGETDWIPSHWMRIKP